MVSAVDVQVGRHDRLKAMFVGRARSMVKLKRSLAIRARVPASAAGPSYSYREDCGLVVSLGGQGRVAPNDVRPQLDTGDSLVAGRQPPPGRNGVKSPCGRGLPSDLLMRFCSPVGSRVLTRFASCRKPVIAAAVDGSKIRLERALVRVGHFGWTTRGRR